MMKFNFKNEHEYVQTIINTFKDLEKYENLFKNIQKQIDVCDEINNKYVIFAKNDTPFKYIELKCFDRISYEKNYK